MTDPIAIELDRRKLQKLVDAGRITWEEIQSAEIVDTTYCHTPHTVLRCDKCKEIDNGTDS